MSLILEALKKSERQRQLGESPSLGSPIMAVSRRRSLMPALIILILLGLAALWWFKRAADAPVATPEAPAVVATAPAPAPAVQDATTFNDSPVAPPPRPVDGQGEVAQSTAASRQPRSKVPPDATSGLAPDLREKVKSGEVVVPNTQLLKPGQPATIDEPAMAAASAGADDAAAEQKAAAAAMAQAAAAARPDTSSAPSPAREEIDPPTPAAVAPAAAPAAPAAAPGPGVKLVWELPYSTRREIPEIKLTMHVYADQPAQRFVIINDDRQVEGDEVGDLKLIEIRRDGVIFDFEGERFLYPRGGR